MTVAANITLIMDGPTQLGWVTDDQKGRGFHAGLTFQYVLQDELQDTGWDCRFWSTFAEAENIIRAAHTLLNDDTKRLAAITRFLGDPDWRPNLEREGLVVA